MIKKIFQVMITLVLLLGIVTPIINAEDDRGFFIPNDASGIPDLALYEYIKNQTKKDGVYSKDLNTITQMRLSDKLYNIKSLQGLDLMELPELKILELDISSLETLDEILFLNQLKELYIESFGNSHINSDLSKLESLNLLSIVDNDITQLPDSFYQLENLNTLILNNTNITGFSDDIEKLIMLEDIEISNIDFILNKKIYELPHLKVLVLQNTGLKKIDDEIANMNVIDTIDFSNNALTSINNKLYSLNSLQKLVLKNNGIEEVSANIQALNNLSYFDITNNKIKTLPVEMTNIDKLKSLYVEGNPIECLPNEFGLLKLNGVNDYFSYYDLNKCKIEENDVEIKNISLRTSIRVSNNGYVNSNLTFYSNEPVYFIVDGITMANLETEYTFEVEGTHTISAIDDNNGVADTFTFTLDKTAPVISVVDNELALSGFKTEVAVNTTESCDFYVNGNLHTSLTDMILLVDNNDYEVYCIDKAKNISNTLQFYIEKEEAVESDNDSQKDIKGLLYVITLFLSIFGAIGVYIFLKKGAQMDRMG